MFARYQPSEAKISTGNSPVFLLLLCTFICMQTKKKTYRNCMLSLVPAQLSITSDNFKWIQSTWTRNPALSTFLAHFLSTWITNHTLQKNHSDTNHQQANRHVSSCILGYVFFLISLFCCLFIVSPLRTAISRSPPQHPPHPSEPMYLGRAKMTPATLMYLLC